VVEGKEKLKLIAFHDRTECVILGERVYGLYDTAAVLQAVLQFISLSVLKSSLDV